MVSQRVRQGRKSSSGSSRSWVRDKGISSGEFYDGVEKKTPALKQKQKERSGKISSAFFIETTTTTTPNGVSKWRWKISENEMKKFPFRPFFWYIKHCKNRENPANAERKAKAKWQRNYTTFLPGVELLLDERAEDEIKNVTKLD